MEHIRALAQIAHKTATEKTPDRISSANLSRAAVADAINSLLAGEQSALSPSLFSGKKKFAEEKSADAFETSNMLHSPLAKVALRPSSAPVRVSSGNNEATSVLEPPSFIKGTLDEIKKSLYSKHVDLRLVSCEALLQFI
jgi:hypothetical protein